MLVNCPYCRQSLIEIDRYGECRIGCINCNRWANPGDAYLLTELSDEDLEAVRILAPKFL